ncbi:MAG: aminotransferase class V-fold PLP-dependent enzyme [Planctomycetota bacterium]
MPTRRQFLGGIGIGAGLGIANAIFDPRRALAALEAFQDPAQLKRSALDVATDETFWRHAQEAFSVDRSLLNLNNGGVSPAPLMVQRAMQRHLDYANSAPSYALWEVLEPQREGVRARLARVFGANTEEIAITRNASEGLETCQLGFDFAPGDEVLATEHDYPRMITTFQQRERRNGIKLVQFPIPVPCEDPAEIVSRYAAHITPRTRMILVSHSVFLTGQILPVREVVALGRQRGIPVIVDGAHSFAHFAFTRDSLDCDYFSTSLHKWMFAPHGTGMLYVRSERIGDLWPLMAAPETRRTNIRKFEEIGTHPAANALAIGEAITFHEGLGIERKEARLRYLRDTWARRLLASPRVRLNTSLDPRFSCGIANVHIDGIDHEALRKHLWLKHKIIVVAITTADCLGLRVTPSVYTTLSELDRFCEAVEVVLRDGLPG